MTVEQLKNALLEKRSYFKESYNTISERFGVSLEAVYDAFELYPELIQAKREYNSRVNESKPNFSDYLKTQIESLKEEKEVVIKSYKSKDGFKAKKGMHIVLSCLHVPFENKQLVKSLAEFIDDYKDRIAGFHLIGDFLDMRSLSMHDRGNVPLQGVTLGYEYKKGNAILDYFDSVLPVECQKTFLYGNHEDRFKRLGSMNEVNQYIDALPSPEAALHLKDRGYLVKTNWREDYFKLGKLQLIHGIFCTTTAAKTHLNRMKTSVMFGHTHRVDSYYETNHGAFNIGCFADIDSEGFSYLSRIERLNWRNAFGLVHIGDEGHFQADIISCHESSFYYGGKQY